MVHCGKRLCTLSRVMFAKLSLQKSSTRVGRVGHQRSSAPDALDLQEHQRHDKFKVEAEHSFQTSQVTKHNACLPCCSKEVRVDIKKYELRLNGAQRPQSFPCAVQRFDGRLHNRISAVANHSTITSLEEDGHEFVCTAHPRSLEQLHNGNC